MARYNTGFGVGSTTGANDADDSSDSDSSDPVGLGHGSTEGATRNEPDDDGDDSDDASLGTTDEQDEAAVSGSDDSSNNNGDVFSGIVSGAEDATGVDVPGEGSVINEGKEVVDEGVENAKETGEKVSEEVVDRAKNAGSDAQSALTDNSDNPRNQNGGPVGSTSDQNPADSIGQESIASDASPSNQENRDTGPGKEAEPENVIESRVPDEENDVLSGTSEETRDVGRTLLGEEAPDKDVTDKLTEGDGSTPFTLSEEERENAKQGAQNYREYFGIGDEAGKFTEDVTGSSTAGDFATGVGQGIGDLAAVVREGPLVADTVIRTGANAGETVKEEGAADTGEAVANTVFSGVRGGVAAFEKAPVETTGRIAGGFAAGATVTRGATGLRTGVRSSRVRSRADSEVDLEDITSEKGVEGENPTFDTDPDAPTDQAVDELDTRAGENPDVTAPGDAESSVFHTTTSDISGSRGARNRVSDATDRVTPGQSADIDVGEGGSELPGLFTSPDASPLGLEMGGGRSSFSAGLARPRLRGGKSDQVVSLPGDDIRGMPEGATGAGYELRRPDGTVKERGLGRGQAKSRAEGTDLEVRPDSSTQGYEFLTEDADAGAIYARPSGSRTPELEGVSPPGSKFVEEGTTAVNMPGRSIDLPGGRSLGIPGTGRTIPMRRFKRMDSDGDSNAATRTDTDGPEGGKSAPDSGDSVDVYSLPTSRSRGVTPSQQAAAGGYLGAGGSTVGSGGTTDSDTTPADPTTATDPTTPTDPSTPTTFGSPGFPRSGIGTGLSGGSSSSGSPTGGSGGGSSTGSSSGTPTTTSGGSSSPPSTGGPSTGSPGSPFYPGDPTPPKPPTDLDLPELDSEQGSRKRRGDGNTSGVFTDFVNPLTGETLETERE